MAGISEHAVIIAKSCEGSRAKTDQDLQLQRNRLRRQMLFAVDRMLSGGKAAGPRNAIFC
jgi:hypothetical protein